MLVLEDAPVRVPPAGSPDEISIVRAMIDDFTIRHGLDPEDPETPAPSSTRKVQRKEPASERSSSAGAAVTVER
jgi:hypothetical protein